MRSSAKLNAVNPQAYLAATITRLVNGWPMRKIDGLMPWTYATASQRQNVARQNRLR
jgi:hypothetical protein